MARAAQLALAAIVIAAALATAPGVRPSSPAANALDDQDQRVADFADAVAEALAGLQGESLDSGFLGTDRGELFTSGGGNYRGSIADALIERGLLDADEAQALARNGVRFVAQQCLDRVGVLATSEIEVAAERRDWWDNNGCEPDFPTLLAWPVYVALSEEPDAP